MKHLSVFFVATSLLLALAACSDNNEKSSSGGSELPLECNEVIEKQVQLLTEQNRSNDEIESARKAFEKEFGKMDSSQAAEICKKQLQPSTTSS